MKSLIASTARLAMILSMPEIEFDVMSVSSSSAATAGRWASATVWASRAVAAARTSAAASASMRATRLTGSRNRNTYAKYGSMITRPRAHANIIVSTAARGTNSEWSDSDSATPTTQVTT